MNQGRSKDASKIQMKIGAHGGQVVGQVAGMDKLYYLNGVYKL